MIISNTLRSLTPAMYVRKSNESEDRQVQSIPAQVDELSSFCARQGADVPTVFSEERSAKRPGRPVFADMIARIEAREFDSILCWATDRLARNPLDAGLLGQMLADGRLRAIVTPQKTYDARGEDGLMMCIELGLAAKYSVDLARNVARGQLAALKAGRWPGPPKLGYLRDHDTREQVPDPERWPVVQEILRMRLRGCSMTEIHNRARDVARLRTRVRGKTGGRPLSMSALYRLMRDPFYAGVMSYRDELHPGAHATMITWDEHEQIVASLRAPESTDRPSRCREFAYKGLFRCGECAARVTAQRVTNRHGTTYVYYRCGRKQKSVNYCPQGAVQEEAIEAAAARFLAEVRIPDDIARSLAHKVVSDDKAQVERQRRALAAKRGALAKIGGKLVRLRELCVDGIVTPAEYQQDRAKLEARRRQLEAEIAQERESTGLQPVLDAISWLNRAEDLFVAADPGERREILRSVSYNPVLVDRNPLIPAKKWVRELAAIRESPGWQTDCSANTTQLVRLAEELSADPTHPPNQVRRL